METENQPHSQTQPILEYSEKGGVIIVRLGTADEKVVTLTEARLYSLRDIIKTVRAQRPTGLVIVGSGPDMFTAGADINLIRDIKDPALGAGLAREGQKIFEELRNLPFPTVAAISGPCVGGGCEMVLHCDYRIISDQKSTVIGLPEVKLGILPGFGGTQRLPRLIGLPKALDIILAGKTLKPKQALQYGLVDEILPFHRLEERAVTLAQSGIKNPEPKMTVIDKFLTFYSLGRAFVKRGACARVMKETKGFYPAPLASLDSALFGLKEGLESGLENEAKELGRLIVTPESKSLVRIFFLTEASKAIGKSAKKDVERTYGVVIGAGVMGAGIAGLLAKSEASVILKDTSQDALNRGVAHIKKTLEKLKYLSDSERSFILNRIEITTGESPNFGNANIAIEAIFEDMEIKKKVLSEISKLVPPDSIIATNTSSLSVTEISSVIENPQRVVGMHFFNPVEKMPLLEIIRAKNTNDKTISIIAALATKLGKYAIVVKDVPGFLINRILSPYLNEAAYLFNEGFAVSDIDKAATRFGMPMGPIRLLDEIGLDVAAHVSEVMVAGYGDRMKGPGFAKTLSQMGKKGKKSGSGFYDFQKDPPLPLSNLGEILGIKATTRFANSPLIEDRLILSLINEAVKCLDEGVAGVPGQDASSQIDLGTVMGMGFPPFRGGLLNYANSIGAKTIHEKLTALEKEHGIRFQVAPGIRERAASGKTFFESI